MNKNLLALVAVAIGVSAQAQIVSVAGTATILGVPPATVAPNTFENDTQSWVYFEKNAVLAANLAVDANSPGTYTSAPTNVINAGTSITSYYLTSDQVGTSGSQPYAGSITFNQRILGVIGRADRLDASDSILGAPTTIYGTGDNERQWEYSQTEKYTLSADMKTITFANQLTTSADQLRIVTEAVPEPATITILAASAAALAARRRKR